MGRNNPWFGGPLASQSCRQGPPAQEWSEGLNSDFTASQLVPLNKSPNFSEFLGSGQQHCSHRAVLRTE